MPGPARDAWHIAAPNPPRRTTPLATLCTARPLHGAVPLSEGVAPTVQGPAQPQDFPSLASTARGAPVQHPSYYKILDVEPEATPQEISRAYRKAARHLHPDTGDERLLSFYLLVREAYEVLSDPARRTAYDRSLRADVRTPPQAEWGTEEEVPTERERQRRGREQRERERERQAREREEAERRRRQERERREREARERREREERERREQQERQEQEERERQGR